MGRQGLAQDRSSLCDLLNTGFPSLILNNSTLCLLHKETCRVLKSVCYNSRESQDLRTNGRDSSESGSGSPGGMWRPKARQGLCSRTPRVSYIKREGGVSQGT